MLARHQQAIRSVSIDVIRSRGWWTLKCLPHSKLIIESTPLLSDEWSREKEMCVSVEWLMWSECDLQHHHDQQRWRFNFFFIFFCSFLLSVWVDSDLRRKCYCAADATWYRFSGWLNFVQTNLRDFEWARKLFFEVQNCQHFIRIAKKFLFIDKSETILLSPLHEDCEVSEGNACVMIYWCLFGG